MSTQILPESALQIENSQSLARRRTLFLLIIFLVWAAVYVGSIFHPPLMDDADSVHAEAAREMLTRHDWVTLHINEGFRYMEKAPLMYWTVATSFRIFGVHDWSARLPIVLGVLALLLIVYRLGKRTYGEEGGFYSALVLATGFGPFIFTRILIPDMMVGLWLALGFDLFLTSLEQKQPSRWVCWGFAATMALDVLTKGLIGLVFPLGTILVFLFLTGNLRHVLKLRLLSSFIVFLAIATPWHLMASFRNPAQGQVKGFFWFYFVNEQILRYLNKRYPYDYDTVPLWLFWGLMLIWLMPWTAFIVPALRQVPARLREWRAGLTERQRGTLLFAIWAAIVLVFFSFSSRQEYYVIPGVPGLALLLGGWLSREAVSPVGSRERRSGRISSAVLMGIGVIACMVALELAREAQAPPPNYDIAELLKKNPDAYRLSFGHFLDLTGKALGAFKAPLLISGMALGAGTVLNWLLRRSNRTFAANITLAIMMVIFLRQAQNGLKIFSPVLTSRVLADRIGAVWKPGDLIEANGDYEAASTLPYYLHTQIRMLNGRDSNIWFGSLFPDAPNLFDNDQSFEKLWHGPQRILLWTEEETLFPNAASITDFSNSWYSEQRDRIEGEKIAARADEMKADGNPDVNVTPESSAWRNLSWWGKAKLAFGVMPGTTLASYFQQMPRPSAALEEAIEARSRAEQQTFEEWKKKAYEQAARGEIVSYGIPAYVKESNCELAKWGGKYILTNELTLCRPPAQQH
jgi:4-amino-4-deoxy-L-arabinose transferase-like glycosyltransferase